MPRITERNEPEDETDELRRALEYTDAEIFHAVREGRDPTDLLKRRESEAVALAAPSEHGGVPAGARRVGSPELSVLLRDFASVDYNSICDDATLEAVLLRRQDGSGMAVVTLLVQDLTADQVSAALANLK